MAERRKREKYHPQRYLKFKGCFGSVRSIRSRLKFEQLAEFLDVHNTKDFGLMMDSLNRVMGDPDLALDFKWVKGITVAAALILKAFY